ncbi:U3 small nucleolar RNA-associated protein 6 [Zancudomyces culisetae]|uniref:U3 small nucleolar RNA-associated protein 6 n=1 Tax=Zancudomyces culisetae TaxID=1213189 RepID=A0A1R1PSM9_ZANCU|nr:U3 small nucleolar RNA-associated protein 6 [Zancudomyces culisetae]|eukprot:OMH83903.1 U3 small nucleolar RNA-associated protein 6 [Zancudomyces culisetae]
MSRVIQVFPQNASLWIEAARMEYEGEGDVEKARKLMQRAIRINKDDISVWIEYCKMELLYIEKIKQRRKVLGIDEFEKSENGQQENNAGEKSESSEKKQQEGDKENHKSGNDSDTNEDEHFSDDVIKFDVEKENPDGEQSEESDEEEREFEKIQNEEFKQAMEIVERRYNKEKENKRKRSRLGQEEEEEIIRQKMEVSNNEYLQGKIALVVYKYAIQSVNTLEMRKQFYDLFSKFKFNEGVQQVLEETVDHYVSNNKDSVTSIESLRERVEALIFVHKSQIDQANTFSVNAFSVDWLKNYSKVYKEIEDNLESGSDNKEFVYLYWISSIGMLKDVLSEFVESTSGGNTNSTRSSRRKRQKSSTQNSNNNQQLENVKKYIVKSIVLLYEKVLTKNELYDSIVSESDYIEFIEFGLENNAMDKSSVQERVDQGIELYYENRNKESASGKLLLFKLKHIFNSFVDTSENANEYIAEFEKVYKVFLSKSVLIGDIKVAEEIFALYLDFKDSLYYAKIVDTYDLEMLSSDYIATMTKLVSFFISQPLNKAQLNASDAQISKDNGNAVLSVKKDDNNASASISDVLESLLVRYLNLFSSGDISTFRSKFTNSIQKNNFLSYLTSTVNVVALVIQTESNYLLSELNSKSHLPLTKKLAYIKSTPDLLSCYSHITSLYNSLLSSNSSVFQLWSDLVSFHLACGDLVSATSCRHSALLSNNNNPLLVQMLSKLF